MRKIRGKNERFDNVFDKDAFTISHLDFLIAIVVSSTREVMEIICHMIGCTRVRIPVLVIMSILHSGEHGFNMGLFNGNFPLTVSKINVVLGLRVFLIRGGCKVVKTWSLVSTIKPVVALDDSVSNSVTKLTLRSVIIRSTSSASSTILIVTSSTSTIVLRAPVRISCS